MSKKITKPNYTQTPNVLFDHWMAILSPGEFKILMAITRKTFGWHREDEKVSITLSQLAEMTGLSRQSIPKMLDELFKHNLIKKYTSTNAVTGSHESNSYEIIVEDDQGGEGVEKTGGVVAFNPPPSTIRIPPPSTIRIPPPSTIRIPPLVALDDHPPPPLPLGNESSIYIKEKEKENNTPLTPLKRGKRMKAPPEEPKERELRIFVTDWEYQKLVEEFGLEEVKLKMEGASSWKQREGIQGGNDYLMLKKWKVSGKGTMAITSSRPTGTSQEMSQRKNTNEDIATKLERSYKSNSYTSIESRRHDILFTNHNTAFSKSVDLSMPEHIFIQECNRALKGIRAPFEISETGELVDLSKPSPSPQSCPRIDDQKNPNSITVQRDLRAARHKAMAWSQNGRRLGSFKVMAYEDRVELNDGAGNRVVRFDVSDMEWERLTGWKQG